MRRGNSPGTVSTVAAAGGAAWSAGSAADAGGLRLKDRIYEVNGQKFADSPQLLQLVKELPGPLEFLVERYGRLRTVTIDVR